jgi:hypothetical protein
MYFRVIDPPQVSNLAPTNGIGQAATHSPASPASLPRPANRAKSRSSASVGPPTNDSATLSATSRATPAPGPSSSTTAPESAAMTIPRRAHPRPRLAARDLEMLANQHPLRPLWVPITLSRHATGRYSWTSPPRRSRRSAECWCWLVSGRFVPQVDVDRVIDVVGGRCSARHTRPGRVRAGVFR